MAKRLLNPLIRILYTDPALLDQGLMNDLKDPDQSDGFNEDGGFDQESSILLPAEFMDDDDDEDGGRGRPDSSM